MDTTTVIITLLAMLNGIIGWNVNRLYRRIDKLEKDMVDMRLNYLSRFDKASEHRHEIKLNILTAISDMREDLQVHIAKTTGEINE